MLRGLLAAEGCKIGRRHVKTLMRRMGIEALYRRPRTTKPEPGHKVYPYLLRGLTIERPNQVWAMDITYIPMARWRRRSASRRWRRLWLVTSSLDGTTPDQAYFTPLPLRMAA
jgi:transposase InsO family protein